MLVFSCHSWLLVSENTAAGIKVHDLMQIHYLQSYFPLITNKYNK